MKHTTAATLATIIDGLQDHELNEFSKTIDSIMSYCATTLHQQKNKGTVAVVHEDLENLGKLRDLLDKMNEALLT